MLVMRFRVTVDSCKVEIIKLSQLPVCFWCASAARARAWTLPGPVCARKRICRGICRTEEFWDLVFLKSINYVYNSENYLTKACYYRNADFEILVLRRSIGHYFSDVQFSPYVLMQRKNVQFESRQNHCVFNVFGQRPTCYELTPKCVL